MSGKRYVYILVFLIGVLITGIIVKLLQESDKDTEGNDYTEITESYEDDFDVTDYVGIDITDETMKDNDSSDFYYVEEDNSEEEVVEDLSDVPTVKKLLTAALEPVGTTLYVYGGGWNEEDTAAGVEALSYGVSPRWKEFFDENNASYNYQNTLYQIHDGLDCTGYVGYTVYQLFGDTYSDIGYVFKSKDMVSEYAGMFDSTFISRYDIDRYYPGDIMGKSGHVFMVIGECNDGSLLFLQASPPVVSLCGTPAPSGNNNSEAVGLAREYMSKFYPESYARYDSCIRDTTFLTNYDQMHWNRNILSDPDGYDNMTPEEILKDLFPE